MVRLGRLRLGRLWKVVAVQVGRGRGRVRLVVAGCVRAV